MKLQLFDIVNSISSKKDLREEEGFDKAYNKFMINRFLSHAPDVVLLANEMNRMCHSQLPNVLHYIFLMKTVHRKKRYLKYAKAEKVENVELIQQYFDVSPEKATEILQLLTDEQVNNIAGTYRNGVEPK